MNQFSSHSSCLNKYIIIVAILSITVLNSIICECPEPELLHPCQCVNDSINCGGKEDINLKHIFGKLYQRLSDDKKHFKRFRLNNTVISELEENTFFDLTFDEIEIDQATNLTLIATHTFSQNNLMTKRIIIDRTPIKSVSPDHDIFNILSSFVNIEYIYIHKTEIREIPSYAFRPLNGYQNKLTRLDIRLSIQKIGNYPFYDLNGLTDLDLGSNYINHIPTNAFHFHKTMNKSISIYLYNNTLNGSSFEIDAFSHIRRPASIHFGDNPLDLYLDEKIFFQFLNQNNMNMIQSSPIHRIDCNDCRSYWLQKDAEILKRIENIKCLDGNKISDNRNFQKCSH